MNHSNYLLPGWYDHQHQYQYIFNAFSSKLEFNNDISFLLVLFHFFTLELMFIVTKHYNTKPKNISRKVRYKINYRKLLFLLKKVWYQTSNIYLKKCKICKKYEKFKPVRWKYCKIHNDVDNRLIMSTLGLAEQLNFSDVMVHHTKHLPHSDQYIILSTFY